MKFIYQFLFAIAGLALKHYLPSGIDHAALSADLEKELAKVEGPKVPSWLVPVQNWAIPFFVTCALGFLERTGFLTKAEEAATGLEPSAPSAVPSPTA